MYRVVHSSGTSLPSLPDIKPAVQRLHDILISWREDSSHRSPKVIAPLLLHKYPNSPSFNSSSLQGADERLFVCLRQLAFTAGFRLYLAHVQHHITFTARFARHHDGDDSNDDSDDDWAVDFDHPDSDYASRLDSECDPVRQIKIDRVTELDGMPIEVEHLKLTIKDILNGDMEDRDVDAHELDENVVSHKSYRVSNPTLTRFYQRDKDEVVCLPFSPPRIYFLLLTVGSVILVWISYSKFVTSPVHELRES